MDLASISQRWIVAGLVVLSAVNSCLGTYVALRGGDISESTEMLWYLGFSMLIAVWTRNDILKRGSSTARELPSFFIFLLWPIVLPLHLLKSRGLVGFAMIMGFAGIYLAPYTAAALAVAFAG